MYGRHPRPLLPLHIFLFRLGRNLALALSLIILMLVIGMCGYHYFEHMLWIDSFANASMILSGMGPLGPLQTFGGKLFAGFYALFSGLTFIAVIGFIFAPLVNRLLHKFHLATFGDN